MVNIWINHCPLDAEILDDDVCIQMKTPWKNQDDYEEQIKLNRDHEHTLPFQWNLISVEQEKSNDLTEISLEMLSSEAKAAGNYSFIVCNKEVTMRVRSTLEACHAAAEKAFKSVGKSIRLIFKKGTLTLEVGNEVEADSFNDT